MILLALIVLAIIAAIAYTALYGKHGEPAAGTAVHTAPERPRLAEDVARWRAAGLLSDQQAAAILAHEGAARVGAPAAAAERARRVPAVAEALGYLGGLLAIIGLVLLVGQYWADMATPTRLALSGGGALVLTAAGALVREHEDPALARFRWFVWLAATAATGLFGGIIGADVFGSDHRPTILLAVAIAVTLHSGLLWWGHERPLQQLTFLGGLVVTPSALVAEFAGEGAVGLTVWVVGACLLLLALKRRTPLALLTEAVGAVALLAGAVGTAGAWQAFGLLFAVASAFLLLAIAAVPGLAPARADERMLAIFGGVGLLQLVPGTLSYFADDAGGATGLTTWVLGVGLVYVATRGLVRAPLLVETLGSAAIVGGAALTGTQWAAFAPLFGIACGILATAFGMLPGQVLKSVLGSLLLLVNVPWVIGRFFPGEGRAPLLILVTGTVILGIAVLLTRMGGRLRREVGGPRPSAPPPTVVPGGV